MKNRNAQIKRIAALSAAVLIGITGCGQSGTKAGQDSSGLTVSGAENAKTEGQASKDEKSAVREIYDVMTVPYMRLQAYGDTADDALDKGVEKIHAIYDLLSTGKPNSEIGKLNGSGSGTLGEDGSYLLKTSLSLYEKTDGAFDVSVYPLMELWGFTSLYTESLMADQSTAAAIEHKAPSDAEIQEMLTKVGSEKITFDPETGNVTLPEGMKIDFGGIAKGYASEAVSEILKEDGVKSALLNLGGNIQTVGRKPDGSKWRIALNDRNKGGFLGILTVEDCAVITSGGYERKFEDAEGNVYFHILDPKTGYPADNGFSTNSSVTIICKDGTLADALSTAMYVMGPEKAEEYWRNHSDEFEMIMMTDDDRMYVTEGIADEYQSDYKFEIIKK